jgi:hypothetical protein
MAEPQLHDVVELARDVGEWPAGTIGAVVDEYAGGVVVEIVAPSGVTLDMLNLPPHLVHTVDDVHAVHGASC